VYILVETVCWWEKKHPHQLSVYVRNPFLVKAEFEHQPKRAGTAVKGIREKWAPTLWLGFGIPPV